VAEEDIENARPGATRAVDVVRASWRALATGGLEAMAAHWHPDIEWRAVEGAVDDVGVFRGRERMRRYYADWLAPFDALRRGARLAC